MGNFIDEHCDRLEWFKTTILPHEGALFARLRRMLPYVQEVEDVVSEVLTRAYASERWRDVENGRAYLFQIARNLVVDTARRSKVVSLELIADMSQFEVDNTMEAGLLARDRLRHVQAITDAMPAHWRRALILRRVYGFSVAEIADQMGISVSTVEKHLTKAVVRLTRAIAEREETDFGDSVACMPRTETDDRRRGSSPRR